MAKASSMEEQLNLARGLRRIPPCAQCRLRKVKCDKQRPCENCQKSGVDCMYNENHGGSGDVESHSELLERVALLEAQLQAVTASLRAKDVAPPMTTVVGVSADESSTLLECNCGRQILGTHYSVHYDYYLNWVELFPNLRDIYFEITAAYEDSDGPKEASPPILGPVQRDPFALQSYLPADAEADLLIKIFFQNVNPFVRMLNRETFFADLTRFRAGQLAQSNSFVALLFSIYGLAVASLLPSDVVASFGVEREWILYKYQEAQEIALHQVDFISSNKLSVFQALLYYLTFLFARGYYQTATALVGLAARNAQRLGLHKDPSYFNYSQWVSEWRRRLWNQVILLDQKAIALQGAISILAFPWDTSLPASANDEAWNTSPSAKPSDTPTLTSAFSQMSFVLLKRAVLAVLCPLRQNLRTRSYTQQLRHVEAGYGKARDLFANVKDDMKPLATFANSIMEIEFGLLRLMAGEGLIRFGEAPPSFRLEHFIGALTLLERVTALEKEAMNPGWMWVYRTEPPLLAIAIVLSHMTVVRDTPYDARAWSQISLVFDRYMNVTSSYSPPIIASLRKFYDLLKSLRTQTSLGLSPMHLGEEFLGQCQFNYFISGEELNLGTLGVAYQEDDLSSLGQMSSDTVL